MANLSTRGCGAELLRHAHLGIRNDSNCDKSSQAVLMTRAELLRHALSLGLEVPLRLYQVADEIIE